jgi:hypothetical protein
LTVVRGRHSADADASRTDGVTLLARTLTSMARNKRSRSIAAPDTMLSGARPTLLSPQGRERTFEEGNIMSEATKEKKKTTIIVDGTKHDWDEKEISYEQVVNLAFDNNPPTGEFIEITVGYRRGHNDNQEGDLHPGGSVKVKDGMIFDVTATDRS